MTPPLYIVWLVHGGYTYINAGSEQEAKDLVSFVGYIPHAAKLYSQHCRDSK